MVITDETIQVETPSNTPPRRTIRRILAIGAAIVFVVVGALVAAVQSPGPTQSDQLQEPASRSRDEIVRDLVTRGVVPAASLDDGTQISGPALAPAPRTGDEIVRDLVARGVVPAASLDDGSQITGPALTP
jgi:hypothetical protein